MDNKPIDKNLSLQHVKDPDKREALSVIVELMHLTKKYAPENDRTLEYLHAIEVLEKAGVDPYHFFKDD